MSHEKSSKQIKPIQLLMIVAGFVVVGYFTVEFLSADSESANIEVPEKEETTSESEDDEIYIITEVMPEFEGGNEGLQRFIANNIVYPPEAKDQNITGRVFISFVVGLKGKVEDVKILKGAHPLLDQAALDVINKLPKFKSPGMYDGKVVRVQFNTPINFTLANK